MSSPGQHIDHSQPRMAPGYTARCGPHGRGSAVAQTGAPLSEFNPVFLVLCRLGSPKPGHIFQTFGSIARKYNYVPLSTLMPVCGACANSATPNRATPPTCEGGSGYLRYTTGTPCPSTPRRPRMQREWLDLWRGHNERMTTSR